MIFHHPEHQPNSGSFNEHLQESEYAPPEDNVVTNQDEKQEANMNLPLPEDTNDDNDDDDDLVMNNNDNNVIDEEHDEPTNEHFTPFFSYTNDDLSSLLLLNILCKISAPMYAYKLIMEWASYANHLNINFDDQPTSSTYLKNLSKRFNFGDMTPIITPAKIDLTPLKGVPSTIKLAHFTIEAAI